MTFISSLMIGVIFQLALVAAPHGSFQQPGAADNSASTRQRAPQPLPGSFPRPRGEGAPPRPARGPGAGARAPREAGKRRAATPQLMAWQLLASGIAAPSLASCLLH